MTADPVPSPHARGPGPHSPTGLLARFAAGARALALGVRWSYLPPLMVYLASGISGLTSIVGTFFVKEHLGLSAAFLAALGFWMTLPWALKVPLGHLVDLYWRRKALLVWLGAALIAVSLLIMIGLLSAPEAMRAYAPAETWYVVSALLAPVGYVMQDVVADAMTIEAVPRADRGGRPIDEAVRNRMHVTMQTLARMATVGGGLLVSIANVVMLRDVGAMTTEGRIDAYVAIYVASLSVPVVSVLGVVLAGLQRRSSGRRWSAGGMAAEDVSRHLALDRERPRADPWLLGGGAAFVVAALAIGLLGGPRGPEILFAMSFVVIGAMIRRLVRELDRDARSALLGTIFVVWVFRALPGPGAALEWWTIDELGFDEPFLARLSLIGGVVGLAGLLVFRRFMADRSIYFITVVLTLLYATLSIPYVAMFHGLHEWTALATGGVVDARTIALVNTALESPLGQIAMVPVLAWVARSAPERLKATYFAVMVSFSNLALSASQLIGKWLNEVFVVTREVSDPATGAMSVPADYSQLGGLLWATTLLGLVLPLAAVGVAKLRGWKSA